VGETDFYTTRDHLVAIDRHVHAGLVDIVLANNCLGLDFAHAPAGVGQQVEIEELESARLVAADMVDEAHPWRHDSGKLAQTVIDVYNRERRASGAPVIEGNT
jgi:2-phospho-L-lactate transferase/gluconeogenesis factor (CofD/UPF0052 family)